MTDELYFYHGILQFIACQLPLGALFVVATVTLYLVLKPRCRRQLHFETPPEPKELDRLAVSGRIEAEAPRRLAEQCNALPESPESSPVPDLPLKLASALTRIYSLMKLLLFAARGSAFLLAWLFYRQAAATDGFSYQFNSRNAGLLLMFSLLVVLLSILEFFAARNICRGSKWSRNYLIFNWLFDFAFLRLALVGCNSPIYLLLAVGCGVYTLYVLLFRRRAVGQLVTDGRETSPAGKGVLAAAALLALCCGFGVTGSEYKYCFNRVSTIVLSQSSSSSSGPTAPKLETLLLIEGAPDATTRQLTRQLAALLEQQTGLSCQIQTFETTPELRQTNDLLPLLIRQVSLIKPEPPSFHLPGNLPDKADIEKQILNHLRLTLPPETLSFQDALDSLAGDAGHELAFEVITLTGFGSRSGSFHHLRLPSPGITFRAKAVTGCDSGSESAAIERLVQQFADDFSRAYRRQQEMPTVRIPAIDTPFQPFPALDLSKLANCQLIYQSHNLEYQTFAVYRFDKQNYRQDLDCIITAMQQIGLTPGKNKIANDRLLFESPELFDLTAELQMGPPPGANRIMGDLATASPYGLLLCKSFQGYDNTPDPELVQRFRQDDLRSFALARGLELLESPEFSVTFDEFFALPDLTFEEKAFVWSNLSEAHRRELGEREFQLFRQLVDEAMARKYETNFPEYMRTLFRQLPAEERAYLIEQLGPLYHRVKFPAEPDGEGIYQLHCQFALPGQPAAPLVLEVELPDRDYCNYTAFFTLVPEADDLYYVGLPHSSRSGISAEALAGEKYYYTRRASDFRGKPYNWDFGGSTSGIYSELLQRSLRDGELSTVVQVDPAVNGYDFDIRFRPLAVTEPDCTISSPGPQ
ncbi:hypothetical protein [Victivallis sp. Marseille-Q1083]|uniref:hypothetical protein n=1 Tax=Victivallis sp. Marseille-Q1083 TaxID=2717288 RepID=UPI00158F3EDF|nr:hypothetical protein [Victivallis sp. Marseille-Q1083]